MVVNCVISVPRPIERGQGSKGRANPAQHGASQPYPTHPNLTRPNPTQPQRPNTTTRPNPTHPKYTRVRQSVNERASRWSKGSWTRRAASKSIKALHRSLKTQLVHTHLLPVADNPPPRGVCFVSSRLYNSDLVRFVTLSPTNLGRMIHILHTSSGS